MIGFGTWGLSGKDYGFISKKESQNLILKSIKAGVKFFDTAPSYGNGRVERIIGSVLKRNKKLRKKIILCTKFGLLPHKSKKLKHNFQSEFIDRELHRSLDNLNTNYIDIYLMHSPNLEVINLIKIINHLKILKKNKKIKHFGISLKNPSDIFLLKNIDFFDFFEFNFNLLDQRAAQIKIFEFLKRKKKKIICRTPLCFGFLTEKMIIKKKLNKNDHRKKFWSHLQFTKWSRNKNLFDNYRKKYNVKKLSIFSILFCLSYKFDYVIPGIMCKKEIDENLQAQKIKQISKKDLKRILEVYNKNEKKIFIKNKKK